MKFVTPVSPRAATGLTAQVYAQIKRDFGALVEPFTLHSPSPKLLAAAWGAAREAEVTGNVPRPLKEAIATTISRKNQCRYCVDAHTIMLDAGGDHALAQTVGHDDARQIPDPRARAIVNWAAATYTPGSPALLSPPFTPAEAPEIIGTAVFYHYVNRMVTVLLGDTPLPSRREELRSPLTRIAGWFFSGAVKRPKQPGESLKFLPDAELPADLAWAAPSPTVAGAFARLAAVIEELGNNSLPPEVRALVGERMKAWNGEVPALNETWSAGAGKDAYLQAAAQLALMTALVPSRLLPGVIYAFQGAQADDEKLLGALAWASFTAARRIGRWLSQKTPI
jgi:AhpD family alkylhydroperoxidase